VTIQRSRLNQLVDETDPEFAGEIIELFLEEFPKQLGNLKQSLVQGDAPGVSLYAHTLKGSSRQFGLEELGAVFSEMEQLGERNSLDGIENFLATATEMYTEAQKLLKDFLATLLLPHAA
jgi:HPt (histidine-containing phosphotransfer) domain-containing protein